MPGLVAGAAEAALHTEDLNVPELTLANLSVANDHGS
jgi:hypothetical protein